MPVTETIRGNQCVIHCWTIAESTNELEALCTDAGIAVKNNFTLEARYRQHMVTLLLFHSLFGSAKLKYRETGKPFAENDAPLSISHSGNVVVMMRSVDECGVDVERFHTRVEKVKHKFLNDREISEIKTGDLEMLVRYWTAKEAMFKVHGSETVFMRNNIFVKNVTAADANAELHDGALILKRKIRFHVLGDMMLAWTEPEHEA